MAYENNDDTMRICKVCNNSNHAWAKYCSICGANLSGDIQNPLQINMNQKYQSAQSQQPYPQPNNMQKQAGSKGGYGGPGLIELIGRICKFIIGLFKFTIKTVRTLFFAAKLLILFLILYYILKLFGFVHSDLLNIDKFSSIFNWFTSKIMSGTGGFIKGWK